MNLIVIARHLLTLFDVPVGLTEAQEWKEPVKEEEVRISQGIVALHATSASAFMFLAMELEDLQ